MPSKYTNYYKKNKQKGNKIMKKAFLCLLLCLGLLLAACSPAADDPPPTPPQDQEQATPAPPPPPPDADPVVDAKTYTVDFSDGNYDFVALNFGAIGADLGAEMSIAQV
ncbi:MAG: hypothetical protein LBD23_16430, partial [Oscillospiraceae bacterium]|nr:hypothetical protein [Oscillospiraceae bacterium]